MRFRANPGLERELARQPAVRHEVRAAAKRVAATAERIASRAQAPWMPSRRGKVFQVVDDGDTVAVVNTDHAGHLQEWGGRNNPPHAPLRRGVRAEGLQLKETDR